MKQILRKKKHKQRQYKPLRKREIAKASVNLSLSAAMSAMRIAHINNQQTTNINNKSIALLNYVSEYAKIVMKNAILLAKAKTINK